MVWSTDQLEFREGEFNDFIAGTNVLLRTFKGVREVPKYSYIKDRWILERFIPGVYAYNPEMPLSMWGSYEPLFVFESNKGEYLPLSLKVVEVIVHQIENPGKVLTEQQRIDAMKELEEKEIQGFMDMLWTSSVEDAFNHNEAVAQFNPSYDVAKNREKRELGKS